MELKEISDGHYNPIKRNIKENGKDNCCIELLV
jgi:hypothetical protein